jgi:predicted transcriptional regulator
LLHDLDLHVDHNFRVRRGGDAAAAVRRRDGTSSLAIDPLEIEANRFAAEILMPYDMMWSDLARADFDYENVEEVKPLARRYIVSPQAMLHRVANIGHI